MLRSPSPVRRPGLFRWFQIMIGVLVICLGTTWVMPGLAQTDPQEPRVADVVLDGRFLFQLTGSNREPAAERVEAINQQLQEAVEAGRSPQVRVETEIGGAPQILLNGDPVLRVRPEDVETEERSPEQQALAWADQIEAAIEQAQQERSLVFRWRSLGISFGVALITVLFHGLLRRLKNRLPALAHRTLSAYGVLDEEQLQVIERLVTLTVLLIQVVLWTAAVLFITNLFPRTRQFSYLILNAVFSSFTTPFLSVGTQSYSIVDFLILLGLICSLFVLSGILTNVLRARVLEVAGIQRGVQEAIAVSAKYAIIALGLLVVLQAWGIDLSSLTLLASAIGLGVGFGFQNIARNLSSGLVLLFERPIQVGDFVEVGDYVGTVEHIGARRTLIRTLDQVSIIVPNSRFLEDEVINWSHQNPVSRLHLPVGVAYHSDVNQVRSALLEAAREHREVLPIPGPNVLFKGFGDSALEFEVLIWIRDPSRQPMIKSDLYFLIEAALRRHRIEIPFPQRDLHMRSGTLPLQFSPQLERLLAQALDRMGLGDHPLGKGAGQPNPNTYPHTQGESSDPS